MPPRKKSIDELVAECASDYQQAMSHIKSRNARQCIDELKAKADAGLAELQAKPKPKGKFAREMHEAMEGALAAAPVIIAQNAADIADKEEEKEKEKEKENKTNVLRVKLLSRNARTPHRQTAGSVGYDLYAAEHVFVPQGCAVIIKTDVAVQLPPGTYGEIKNRSSLSGKYGLLVGGGVIDPDYTGGICVVLINVGSEQAYEVNPGDRIAQLLVLPYATPAVKVVEELQTTARGAGGFGSTGTR